MWEEIKRFIKQNPLMAAGVALVLVLILYYLFSMLYSTYEINKLKRENEVLQTERDKLVEEKQDLLLKRAQTEGRIELRETELKEKDELLKATTDAVLTNKRTLDDATRNYNELRSDTTPLSGSELRSKLCTLYPESCH